MPWATRRTVKWEVTAPRRLRITTPSNAWTRSRSPSTTRAITRTVSPGRKSGTFGFCLSGTIDFRSMATLPSLLFALPKGKPLPLLRRQLHRGQEVRAPPRREQQVLPPPPLRHLLVVPGDQHSRPRPAPDLRRPRVVRRLQQAGRERLLRRRFRRAEGAGDVAHDRVHQDHRRQLAAGEPQTADP